jgi:hypothetical protein
MCHVVVRRLTELRAAKLGLEAFLEAVLRFQALSMSQAAALGVTAILAAAANAAEEVESGASGRGSSSIVAGSSASGRAARAADPAVLCSQKIERYKQNTAAKAQLRELALANLNARRAQLAGAAGASATASGSA